MSFTAHPDRYKSMCYRRSGNSGLLLPTISMGLWHNFGEADDYDKCSRLILSAFNNGITHFDLANNYGPPPGAAERTFGRILHDDLGAYRDEIIISTKAGYSMWPGPYGDWGSKKYLVASLDQSLKRLGVDYVDIFYHHRPDPFTPLEETMATLDLLVRQGKTLYVGISSYDAEETSRAAAMLRSMGTPLLIHQPKYSLLERSVEAGVLDAAASAGMGVIAFSALAQGLLTNRYLQGIPGDSRAASGRGNGALQSENITSVLLQKLTALNALATGRGQTLAQMSLAWVLKDPRITSVIVGASREEQLLDNLQSMRGPEFTKEELEAIDAILQ